MSALLNVQKHLQVKKKTLTHKMLSKRCTYTLNLILTHIHSSKRKNARIHSIALVHDTLTLSHSLIRVCSYSQTSITDDPTKDVRHTTNQQNEAHKKYVGPKRTCNITRISRTQPKQQQQQQQHNSTQNKYGDRCVGKSKLMLTMIAFQKKSVNVNRIRCFRFQFVRCKCK